MICWGIKKLCYIGFLFSFIFSSAFWCSFWFRRIPYPPVFWYFFLFISINLFFFSIKEKSLPYMLSINAGDSFCTFLHLLLYSYSLGGILYFSCYIIKTKFCKRACVLWVNFRLSWVKMISFLCWATFVFNILSAYYAGWLAGYFTSEEEPFESNFEWS